MTMTLIFSLTVLLENIDITLNFPFFFLIECCTETSKCSLAPELDTHRAFLRNSNLGWNLLTLDMVTTTGYTTCGNVLRWR